MIRLKDPKTLIYFNYQICMIDPCDNNAINIYATESNVIDVCEFHYKQLEAEKYKS